ncbi:MAG: insulinase family protein [Oscillospiraceae bacterium]|nr:insulinase family protein [Oscillospiraceae bacterium]
MEKITRRELLPGIRLCCVQTDRFRTGTFSVSFLRRLRREDAAKNALAIRVLARGCRAWPDMGRIRAACQEAYGAVVEPELRQYGEVLALGFSAAFPDDPWLPRGSRNLERVIRLVSDLCLDPDTRGGLLRNDYVLSERRNLRDRILTAVNDKRTYARIRARALMFPEEDYGIYPLGSSEEAEKLTHLILTRHYQQLLASSPVRLFYCGALPFEEVRDTVLASFLTLPGGAERRTPETEIRDSAAVLRRETEYIEAEQGNLVLGCRLGGPIAPEEQPVLEVFNRYYGASHTSRLFRRVREQESLCYSISSGYDRHKAVFSVSAGISFARRDEVMEAVLEELDRCGTGDLVPEDLEAARVSAAAAYRMAGDRGSALDSFYLGQELLESAARPEELAALALEVSPEEVTRMAQRVQPELDYFLRGEEKEAEA